MSKNRVKTAFIKKYSDDLKRMIDSGKSSTDMKKWMNNRADKPLGEFVTRQNMSDVRDKYSKEKRHASAGNSILSVLWTEEGLAGKVA